MNTVNYPERRAFTKFDDRHHVLYLDEKAVTYTPEPAGPGDEETVPPAPIEGYSYTGPMADGGTMIAATEATYGAFVAGLLRQRYSADDVEALQANMMTALHNAGHPRAAEFAGAWDEFQSFREECKAAAKEVINREIS